MLEQKELSRIVGNKSSNQWDQFQRWRSWGNAVRLCHSYVRPCVQPECPPLPHNHKVVCSIYDPVENCQCLDYVISLYFFFINSASENKGKKYGRSFHAEGKNCILLWSQPRKCNHLGIRSSRLHPVIPAFLKSSEGFSKTHFGMMWYFRASTKLHWWKKWQVIIILSHPVLHFLFMQQATCKWE